MDRLFRIWLLLSSLQVLFGLTMSLSPGLSYDAIARLAQKRYQNEDSLPMKGRVAVITGAAGGIGGELSKIVYRLGGTVVALDRNAVGLETLQKTLIQGYSNGNDEDRVVLLPTNHEDLASVKQSSEIITSRFGQVDLLVNNAGLAYSYSEDPMVSAHGKDLAFTVNYLSHFLLTERLLPSLDGGRIVHVTSTFHWKVDGSELLADAGMPLAYESDPLLQSPKHVERSYANTKLAQIWHSRSIAAKARGIKCNSVCVCPTWASTGIAGDEARDFLETYAFSIKDCGPGITSAVNGILRSDDELGDALNNGRSFVANSKILDYISFPVKSILTSELVNSLGWRDVLTDLLGGVILLGQRFTHEEFILQETSPESYGDEQQRDRFYEWSKEEVKPWLDDERLSM